ncbi:MAG: 16S rRNA (cytosine(1402)-N(4))-methyltransferase RsmH [Gammaproteobacteria bacterium]
MRTAGEIQQHKPVLLDEVLEALSIVEDGIYIDCTFGRGGHSKAMLNSLGKEGKVIGIDRDPSAIEAGNTLASEDKRFSIEQGAFSKLQQIADQKGVTGKVSGILFDLGVSSPQLDNAERGFSFMRDGPLDMRMDPEHSSSAADWIAKATDREMVKVFSEYGEERFSKRIARAIVARRDEEPVVTTKQLADLIKEVTPNQSKPGQKAIHPATRVFQAIRIFINDELGEVKNVLDQAMNILAPGGRLAVISFHSLEDRIVKRFMKKAAAGDNYPKDLPIPTSMLNPDMKLIGKMIKASADEIERNPRSRSAVLRVAERMGV